MALPADFSSMTELELIAWLPTHIKTYDSLTDSFTTYVLFAVDQIDTRRIAYMKLDLENFGISYAYIAASSEPTPTTHDYLVDIATWVYNAGYKVLDVAEVDVVVVSPDTTAWKVTASNAGDPVLTAV